MASGPQENMHSSEGSRLERLSPTDYSTNKAILARWFSMKWLNGKDSSLEG